MPLRIGRLLSIVVGSLITSAVTAGIVVTAILGIMACFAVAEGQWSESTGEALTLVGIAAALVGLVAGMAARIPQPEIPVLRSLAIISAGGVLAIVLFGQQLHSPMFLVTPTVGVLAGGAWVVAVGILRSRQR